MHDRHVGVAEDEKKGRREGGKGREEGSRESGRKCCWIGGLTCERVSVCVFAHLIAMLPT